MDTIELGQQALQQESLRRLEPVGEIGAGRNAWVVPDDWKWEFLWSLIPHHNALRLPSMSSRSANRGWPIRIEVELIIGHIRETERRQEEFASGSVRDGAV
jgi:hypothetical protein